MPMAAAIVPVVIAAAGTAASISAQSKQAAQQNASIDAQISSNKRQEQLRQASNSFQMRIVKQQGVLERIARQAETRQQQDEIRMAVKNAESQNISNNMQSGIDEAQGQTAAMGQVRALQDYNYGIEQARIQNQAQRLTAESAAVSNTTQVYGAAAQSSTQAAAAAKGVQENLRKMSKDTTSMRAQMYAMGAGRGRTSEVLQAQTGAIDEALAQLNTTRDVVAGGEQAIMDADKLEDSNKRIASISYGLQETELSNAAALAQGQGGMVAKYQQYLRDQGTMGRSRNDLTLENSKQQATLARQSNRLSKKMADKQGAMDLLLTQAGMVTGYQASVAQASAQRAALAGQRVSGPGAFENAAKVAQSLTPLLGLFQGGGGGATVQPYGGYQPGGQQFGINNNIGNFSTGAISRYPSTINTMPPGQYASTINTMPPSAPTYTTNSNIRF